MASTVQRPPIRPLIALDLNITGTANVAVTMVLAGNRLGGGWALNPEGASASIGIAEVGTAAIGAANTRTIPPGGWHDIAPSTGAVSIVASDANHPVCGWCYGLPSSSYSNFLSSSPDLEQLTNMMHRLLASNPDTSPAVFTLTPLLTGTVATGGVAVTVLAAGSRAAGGWLANPASAPGWLGINEIGTASGTTSQGSTLFIMPGAKHTLQPSNNPVSVISASSGHTFSGTGYS